MLKALAVAIWVMLLLIFRKTKMHFFMFITGCVGLFGILMYLGRNLVDIWMEYAVAFGMGIIGDITGILSVFPEYRMITVYHGPQAISFLVDYECSGFIETLVFISIIAFYPVYGAAQKFLLALTGTLYVFFSNIIRVFIICVLIRIFGTSIFFISHTIFARLVFFILMIIMFYYVFTRPHILSQRVGELADDH